MLRHLLFALLFLTFSFSVADARMYRWIDEQGQVHFTDDPNLVPAEIKETARRKEAAARKEAEEEQEERLKKATRAATLGAEPATKIPGEKKFTGPLRIVPPVTKGSIADLWSRFRDNDSLYIPLVVESDSTPDNPTQDWREGYLRVKQKMKGKELSFIAVYTDPRMFEKKVLFRTTAAPTVLKWVMEWEGVDGIYFNPATYLYSEFKYAYGINNYGLAEIVGYLESEPDTTNRPWHERALEAEKNQQWFQVLYYWGLSYREPRPGDNWQKAEFAKIRAYQKIGYYWSKERALFELDWYVGKYGDSPEATALRTTLK